MRVVRKQDIQKNNKSLLTRSRWHGMDDQAERCKISLVGLQPLQEPPEQDNMAHFAKDFLKISKARDDSQIPCSKVWCFDTARYFAIYIFSVPPLANAECEEKTNISKELKVMRNPGLCPRM